MPVENFSVLLGKLGGSANADAEFEGPAFRVSTKVAEVMLSLSSVLSRSASRASPYYEETSVSAPSWAPLSLPELKEQIARAASIAELRCLRRRFAVFSHPDHKGSGDADATREMAAANQMIDEAIRSMRRPR